MKKHLLLTAIVLISFNLNVDTAFGQKTGKQIAQKKETLVYICDSRTAYVYHTGRSCRGLNRCSHGVLRVSITDAKNVYGRRACKICR